MASFYEVWSTFWDEFVVKLQDSEHDLLGALSVYDRIDDASNQGMEGANHDLNTVHAITASYKKRLLKLGSKERDYWKSRQI